MHNEIKITGLILAGGLARRMGGVDKGLQPFRGKPLVAHVLERLAPQVDDLIINANQHRPAYEALGYPVIADTLSGYAGPLAGLHAGLAICSTPLLLSSPCDSPFLPHDLVNLLRAQLIGSGAQLAVAQCGGRAQLVIALFRRELQDSLSNFLHGGGHKVETWYTSLKVIEVPFEDQAAFANINTLEELQRLEAE